MASAPSEDSYQPGHAPSLIRVFDVRKKKAWVLSYPLSAQRRLWSDWADAQSDLSLRWAHSHFVGFVTRRLIFGFKTTGTDFIHFETCWHLRIWFAIKVELVFSSYTRHHSSQEPISMPIWPVSLAAEHAWTLFYNIARMITEVPRNWVIAQTEMNQQRGVER